MVGYPMYDLTPTHYGIGSETPNLKPTGFKSKRIHLLRKEEYTTEAEQFSCFRMSAGDCRDPRVAGR